MRMRYVSAATVWLLYGTEFLCPPASLALADDAPQITGVVVLGDGMPVAGATVRAVADCRTDPSKAADPQPLPSDEGGAVETTTTAADGTFSFPAFAPGCGRYRLGAGKEADYWVVPNVQSYGRDDFNSVDFDVSSSTPSRPATIRLTMRGGLIVVTVKDTSTGRFIDAGVIIVPRPQKPGGVIGQLIPHGQGPTPTIRKLLPQGDYRVRVVDYPCGDERFVTQDGARVTITIKPGVDLDENLEMNVQTVRPLKHDASGKLAPSDPSPKCRP